MFFCVLDTQLTEIGLKDCVPPLLLWLGCWVVGCIKMIKANAALVEVRAELVYDCINQATNLPAYSFNS